MSLALQMRFINRSECTQVVAGRRQQRHFSAFPSPSSVKLVDIAEIDRSLPHGCIRRSFFRGI